jgi:NAD-dependent deacetylase sirtuin 1
MADGRHEVSLADALEDESSCKGTEDAADQPSKRRRVEEEADKPAVMRYDVTDDANNDTDGDLNADLPDLETLDSPDDCGPLGWVQRQVLAGVNPRDVLTHLIPTSVYIAADVDDFTLWKLVVQILSEPSPREKLLHINTIDDVINLLQTCQKIVVVTGAGISVSCGIPDFRSRDGIYARLAVDFPDLPNPQAMFDINFFRRNPLPFYKFAKEIYPGQFQPSLSHKFIALLESRGQLLRNYTQNIDTLEQSAGLTRVVQCHGSFATALCTSCKYRVDCEVIRSDIMNQVVPKCPKCSVNDPEVFAVMKPDIVFFGEGLSDVFFDTLKSDENDVDLLIVIGSSMKVRPVAMIPNIFPANVPQILINKEPLPHLNFDVELLGDCNGIIECLLTRLGEGWNHLLDSKPLEDKSLLSQQIERGMQTTCIIADENKSDACQGYNETDRIVSNGSETSSQKEESGDHQAGSFTELLAEARKRGEPFMHFPPSCYMFSGVDLNSSESSEDESDEDSNEDSNEQENKENGDIDPAKEILKLPK